MGKQTSLRKIARMCGISPATVSRIANGIGSFSDETRALVLRTMQQEGYEIDPLLLPGEKRPGRPVVGVVLYDYTNEYISTILAELSRCLQSRYTVITCCSERSSEQEAQCVSWLREQRISGLVIFPTISFHSLSSVPGTPTVYSGVPSLARDLPDQFCVISDDYVGGQLAARELLRKGCRKPIILNNRRFSSSASRQDQSSFRYNDRIPGFLEEFSRSGLPLSEDVIYDTDLQKSNFDNGRDTTAYLLAKGVEFDSVFACNDWIAYGALTALRINGIAVPEQVKVVGFDGLRIARNGNPPITTVCQNTSGLAHTIADTLLALIEGREEPPRQQSVPTYLFEGRTT